MIPGVEWRGGLVDAGGGAGGGGGGRAIGMRGSPQAEFQPAAIVVRRTGDGSPVAVGMVGALAGFGLGATVLCLQRMLRRRCRWKGRKSAELGEL